MAKATAHLIASATGSGKPATCSKGLSQSIASKQNCNFNASSAQQQRAICVPQCINMGGAQPSCCFNFAVFAIRQTRGKINNAQAMYERLRFHV